MKAKVFFMKKILIIGAGRSATTLIKYLNAEAKTENFQVTVADLDLKLAESKTKGMEFANAISLNALNEKERLKYLVEHDLIISMLPAMYHKDIVASAIAHKKPVITPSYLSDEVKALHQEAIKKGVLVLNELGLDPGIDHMSAMKMIDTIKAKGGKIEGFESFCGGVLSPETEKDNPWNYKFTWNPRNVVLAGSGGAVKFFQEGTYKYIPYQKVFRRTEIINIEGYGQYEGYANRDSLKYREVYSLQEAKTLYRGTFRRKGYCKAWDLFVQLGMTDDSYLMENVADMTHRDFLNAFLAYNPNDSVELKFMQYLGLNQDDDEILNKMKSLDLFENIPVGLNHDASPAQIMQHILAKKWTLKPDDKDLCIMWHKIVYTHNGKRKAHYATMALEGENSVDTAMSKSVGLPLGIAAKLILNGVLNTKGVLLPIQANIYEPILKELAVNGIHFSEKEEEL